MKYYILKIERSDTLENKSFLERIGDFTIMLTNWLDSIEWNKVLEYFALIGEGIEKMPKAVAKVHHKLALNGWYLLGEIDLKNLYVIMKGTHEQIDDIMISHVESNLDTMVDKIIETFPKRASIIEDAIKAHKEGNYNLSVPILLIQADGISYEMFEVSFFQKTKTENP